MFVYKHLCIYMFVCNIGLGCALLEAWSTSSCTSRIQVNKSSTNGVAKFVQGKCPLMVLGHTAALS
jgi:hypothetical protein